MTEKSMMEHFRRLENLYNGHPLNDYFEAELTISDKTAKVNLPIKKSFHHAAHAVHGAVYFKALDDAAFFAANSVVFDVFVLTASFTTYFTRPVFSGVLKSIGKLVNAAKSQFICEAILYNSDDQEIGRGSGIYIRSKIELNEDLGYI